MPDSSHVKRVIAKCLGAFWILDGLLQFQPAMFGQDFVTNVLVPNLSAQPHWLYDIVNAGISLWNLNPALNNLGVGSLQIAIGLLLLFPLNDTRFKIGAWISIVWGVVVWFCGEGAGLLLTGVASFYTGAPGAVLLYVVLAALLLVPGKIRLNRLPQIAGWMFIGGALLQLQSAFWTVDGAQGTAMAAMMEPVHVLNAFPILVSNLLGVDPVVSNIILTALLFVFGIAILWKPSRATGIVTLVFLFFVWWIGQDFGMLSTFPTGTATDPQAVPILALFLLPLVLTARS
jgi:hypothetical protein